MAADKPWWAGTAEVATVMGIVSEARRESIGWHGAAGRRLFPSAQAATTVRHGVAMPSVAFASHGVGAAHSRSLGGRVLRNHPARPTRRGALLLARLFRSRNVFEKRCGTQGKQHSSEKHQSDDPTGRKTHAHSKDAQRITGNSPFQGCGGRCGRHQVSARAVCGRSALVVVPVGTTYDDLKLLP